jgi:hypothetical protein
LITKERKAESDIILITYTVYFVEGVLNIRFQERYMETPLQKRKRMNLKKGLTNICGHLPPTRKEEEEKKRKDFAIVSPDESFFFYDSLVRRVWIDAKKRPVIRIIGSHEIFCLFGAVSMDQKQLFRQVGR